MSVVAAGVSVRPACADDAARIAEIWNHEVRDTLATTDTEPRDLPTQRAWLAAHTRDYPVIVAATASGDVVGYAALTAYRPKPAFRRTVEDSVYVDRGRRGGGVGRLLLGRLLELAMAAGHHSMIARITAENHASRHLHEGLGFRLVGIEEEVAFKRGRWIDVAMYQRRW